MTKQRQSDSIAYRWWIAGYVQARLRIILPALVLIAAATAFVIFKNSLDNEMVLGALGICDSQYLLPGLVGDRLSGYRRRNPTVWLFLNSHPDGTLITTRRAASSMPTRLWRPDRRQRRRMCSRSKRCCRAARESTGSIPAFQGFGRPGGQENFAAEAARSDQAWRLRRPLVPAESAGAPGRKGRQALHVDHRHHFGRDDQERYFKVPERNRLSRPCAAVSFLPAAREIFYQCDACRMARP